jgi:hypothetical protein
MSNELAITLLLISFISPILFPTKSSCVEEKVIIEYIPSPNKNNIKHIEIIIIHFFLLNFLNIIFLS